MMYLDLDEFPVVFQNRWFWSVSRPALARFRRGDHLGPKSQPLADAVRNHVEKDVGRRPDGPIRLLTNLSYFGYCFNPVSFYYCFDAGGQALEYIVAEVNNTPWGERDLYVLDCTAAGASQNTWRFSPEKKMHVSPFMPMKVKYDWTMARPADRLSVSMSNIVDDVRVFGAAMVLDRKEITGRSLASVLLRFPLQTLKVISAIYWEALRLWIKRCPIYAHPAGEKEVSVR
jgi:DUF1365 family protein